MIILVLIGLIGSYVYYDATLVEEQRASWEREAADAIAFGSKTLSSEESRAIRTRLDQTVVRLEKTDIVVRRKRGGSMSPSERQAAFPNNFYRGTTYGLVAPSSLELRSSFEDALRNLNPEKMFKITFEEKNGHNRLGWAVLFRHKVGAYNHDEKDAWHVMWIARRFERHYVYKWWPHVWGPPHGHHETYDHEHLESFKHSTMMESVLPSNPEWSSIASQGPVVAVRSPS